MHYKLKSQSDYYLRQYQQFCCLCFIFFKWKLHCFEENTRKSTFKGRSFCEFSKFGPPLKLKLNGVFLLKMRASTLVSVLIHSDCVILLRTQEHIQLRNSQSFRVFREIDYIWTFKSGNARSNSCFSKVLYSLKGYLPFETWPSTIAISKLLDIFLQRCFRRILKSYIYRICWA